MSRYISRQGQVGIIVQVNGTMKEGQRTQKDQEDQKGEVSLSTFSIAV